MCYCEFSLYFLAPAAIIIMNANDHPKIPSFGNVILDINNSIIPAEKLKLTLSAKDGLSFDNESQLRFWGSDIIQVSGTLLKLSQTTIATGSVLYQRYYYSQSFVRHESFEIVAMACIFLATKIKEEVRKVRDIINVFHHIELVRSRKSIRPLISHQDYTTTKMVLIKAETRILKELGFCVHVKVPHQLIIMQIQCLGLNNDTRLLQVVLNYLNDSFRSSICVQFPPETIAATCVYLGLRRLKIIPDLFDPAFPTNPSLFDALSVSENGVIQCTNCIERLYKMKKPDSKTLKQIISSLREERTKRKSFKSCQKHALNVETTIRGLSITNNPGGDIEHLCKLDCPNHADNSHSKTLDLGGNRDVNPRSYSKTEFVPNHILSQVQAYSTSFEDKNLNSFHSVDPSGSKPNSYQVGRGVESHNRSSRHNTKRRYNDIQFSKHRIYMSKRRRSDENESDYDFRIEYSSKTPRLRERLQMLDRQCANNSELRRQFSNVMCSKPVSNIA